MMCVRITHVFFGIDRPVSYFHFAENNVSSSFQFRKYWFRRCNCRWFHHNTRFHRDTLFAFVVYILVVLAKCFVGNRIRIFVRLASVFGIKNYGCHWEFVFLPIFCFFVYVDNWLWVSITDIIMANCLPGGGCRAVICNWLKFFLWNGWFRLKPLRYGNGC